MIEAMFNFDRPDAEIVLRAVMALLLLGAAVLVASRWYWQGELVGQKMTPFERRYATVVGIIFSVVLALMSATAFADESGFVSGLEVVAGACFWLYVAGIPLLRFLFYMRDRRAVSPTGRG